MICPIGRRMIRSLPLPPLGRLLLGRLTRAGLPFARPVLLRIYSDQFQTRFRIFGLEENIGPRGVDRIQRCAAWFGFDCHDVALGLAQRPP